MVNRSVMILILVLAFAIGYLYYSQTVFPIGPTPVNQPGSEKDNFMVFKSLTIDFSVIDNPILKSLRTFGESPVKPGITGKRDIFAPL